MYINNKILIGKNETNEAYLLLEMANRHGIITGASGSGKTIISEWSTAFCKSVYSVRGSSVFKPKTLILKPFDFKNNAALILLRSPPIKHIFLFKDK